MCSTVIQLNETHTMKGEQEIVDMPKKPDMIYFGLMPHKLDPEVDIVHSGFQGCMNYLQVSQKLFTYLLTLNYDSTPDIVPHTDYGHPERAFFQKLETFVLGQTNCFVC